MEGAAPFPPSRNGVSSRYTGRHLDVLHAQLIRSYQAVDLFVDGAVREEYARGWGLRPGCTLSARDIRGSAQRTDQALVGVRGFPWCNQSARFRHRECHPAGGSCRFSFLNNNCSTSVPMRERRLPARKSMLIGRWPHQCRLAVPDEPRTAHFASIRGSSRMRSICLDKVLAVIPEMETEQIVAEHAVEQLFFPGKYTEGLAVRPGDVPELSDDQVGIAFLEIAGQKRKMVILDEHERGAIIGFFEDCIAKEGVNFAVCLPVLELKHRAGECGVAERPRALRWPGRGSSPALPPWSTTLCGGRKPGSSGGTATWSDPSTVARSASPEPCPTQTPPAALITGSRAAAMPLAGRRHSIESPANRWMYASRLATTII